MLSKYTIEQKRDVLINDFGTYKSMLKRNYQDNYERKEDEYGAYLRISIVSWNNIVNRKLSNGK